jgi:prefoldin subunit 5
VEEAQTELKQCKQETNTANREITILKKEQAQLQATLNRYRKMVQDMSADHYQLSK